MDFDLSRGELVVLLGPSGSGKSTLLNILGGLDVPTAGRLAYGEQDLSRPTEEALTQYRRRHVGFVFQFYNLIPSLTAHENVALVADIAERPMSPDEALDLVGLARAPGPLPLADVGRRAAARRHRARRRQAPGDPALRRADGRAGRGNGRLVLEVLDRVNRELGASVARRHPQRGHRAHGRSRRHARRRADRDRHANAHRGAPAEVSW